MHKFSMQIATSGKGFCRAAGKASALIVSNILKVAAVNILGDLILFLGKVCVSLVCALFAFLMLETHKYKSGNSQVSSPLFPVLVSNYPIPHPLMHTTLNPVWPL
jgi:choline transporter-like protein 2/4/5